MTFVVQGEILDTFPSDLSRRTAGSCLVVLQRPVSRNRIIRYPQCSPMAPKINIEKQVWSGFLTSANPLNSRESTLNVSYKQVRTNCQVQYDGDER